MSISFLRIIFAVFLLFGTAVNAQSLSCQELLKRSGNYVHASDQAPFNAAEVRLMTVLHPKLTSALGYYRAENGHDFWTPTLKELNENMQKLARAHGYEPIFLAAENASGPQGYNFIMAANGKYFYSPTNDANHLHDFYHNTVFSVFNLHPNTRRILKHAIQINRAYAKVFDEANERYGSIVDDIIIRSFGDTHIGIPLETTVDIADSFIGIYGPEVADNYKKTHFDNNNNPIVPHTVPISRAQWLKRLVSQVKVLAYANPIIAQDDHPFTHKNWSYYTNATLVEKGLQALIEQTEQFIPLLTGDTLAKQQLLLATALKFQKEKYYLHVLAQMQKIDEAYANALTEQDYVAAATELLQYVPKQFISDP